jgi:hypothetical protein
MSLADLNAALGLIEGPRDLVSRNSTEFFQTGNGGTQPGCDNLLSCSYTINCGSASGTSCACQGC